MTVNFVDRSKVEYVQGSGSDVAIYHAAKVSTGGAFKFHDALLNDLAPDHVSQPVSILINFLMKNRHGSPFEHTSMTFRLHTPIVVMREFMRHRVGWSYNEESGRYRELDPDFYLPREMRPLQQEGKPGAYEFTAGTPQQRASVLYAFEDTADNAWQHYMNMLDDGIAKEVARMVLPLNIMTSAYVTCNARSMMHFLSLRTKCDTSKFRSYPMYEIEEVANRLEAEFAKLFPITWEAWDEHGRVAP